MKALLLSKKEIKDLRNLAAQHQEIVIIPLNITDPSSVEAAAAMVTERLNGTGLNLLINNAGIASHHSKVESQSPENMAEVYKTNVIGPMMISQAFLPLLRKGSQESPMKGMSCSKASIVNISSYSGSITDVYLWKYGQVIPYRCSKAALNMLTRCQSLAFSDDEILCVTLHPGWVLTDMGGNKAPMTVDSSVTAVLNLLAHLSEKETGTFLNWEGKVLPW